MSARIAKPKFRKPDDFLEEPEVYQVTFTEKSGEKLGNFYRNQELFGDQLSKKYEIFVNMSTFYFLLSS
jgi:hypothetical protein